MSFIEEITPFIGRIELHVKGHGRFSKREELIKVRDIHFEYIRSKDFKVPTDINCSSCLGHMMNQLIGEIGRELIKEEKEVRDNTTFIKGSNEPIKTGHKMSFPKVENPKPDVLVWDDNYKSMKWGAFKKYCTAKGLTVPKKTRKQLEEELNNL